MTGYGEAAGSTDAGELSVELRTVNHRYLNANVRLPNSLNRLENEVREWLKTPFSRGHVNCTIRLDPGDSELAERSYELDEAKVRNYLALFRELREKYSIEGTVDLQSIMRFNDVIVRTDNDEALAELPAEQVKAVLGRAAAQAVEMREEEGKRLQKDLAERIDAIENALSRIEDAAPARIARERDRLRDAVTELLDGHSADPDRIAQEIAFLAEKWDINEELVRFRSHNELFGQLLASNADEPVGKRLAFLVQEMHREANTIGSKANDADISHLVVAIKDEIERLREQVENVE